MIKNRTISILALVSLGGCAVGIPEGVPTAMLRFTAEGYLSQIYPVCPGDRSLVKAGFVNNSFSKEVSPIKMYGTREDKNSEVMERLIPAGRQIGFAFTAFRSEGATNEYYECNLAFAFTPAPGKQYQADYQWPKKSEGCLVRLFQLTESSGTIRKNNVPVKLFNFGSRDQACAK